MYLSTMDKHTAEEMREMKRGVFVEKYLDGDESKYFPVSRFPTHREVFELGKNIDEELVSGITGNIPEPFFKDEQLQSMYTSDTERVYLVGKKGVINLIEEYRKIVVSSYEYLLNEPDNYDRVRYGQNAKEKKIDEFLNDKLFLWDNEFVDYLDVNEKSLKLHFYWEYEYLVFNLLHILEVIDWDKKELILYEC